MKPPSVKQYVPVDLRPYAIQQPKKNGGQLGTLTMRKFEFIL